MTTRKRARTSNATDTAVTGSKPNAYLNFYCAMNIRGVERNVKLCAASLWEDDDTHSRLLSRMATMTDEARKEFFIALIRKGSVQLVVVDDSEDEGDKDFIL